jgi:4-aminobutyrate aminotransferase-like enzyme
MTAEKVTAENSTGDTISKHKEYIWPCAATYYEKPLALERGEGMHVWDTDGNRYLDCFGGVLTVSVGHARPEVVEAVSRQVGQIAHTSTLYVNRLQAELAEKVAQIAPGNLKKSFFTNSGTEASPCLSRALDYGYDRYGPRALEARAFGAGRHSSRARALLLSLPVQPQA